MEREPLLWIPFVAWAVGDIPFGADDRLDASFLRQLIYIDCAVEVSVVGQGNRRLFEFCGSVDHVA